ncbi:MAG: (2Fe-2S) ferredoxin domain-containing protein [Bacteroidia bacterium]|jgi:(2Fe-2S) ferredoxin
MRYEKHIFICANQKAEGKSCCGEARGLQLIERFREVLNEKGLKGKVRANRAGCLDACKLGPTVVIYPDGTYYGHVQLEDVEKIVEEHILNNRIVKENELLWDESGKG